MGVVVVENLVCGLYLHDTVHAHQHGEEICFRLRRRSPFWLLFEAYRLKVAGNAPSLVFLYRGAELSGSDCPETVGCSPLDYILVREEEDKAQDIVLQSGLTQEFEIASAGGVDG